MEHAGRIYWLTAESNFTHHECLILLQSSFISPTDATCLTHRHCLNLPNSFNCKEVPTIMKSLIKRARCKFVPFSLHPFIHSFISGSTAHCLALAVFQFLGPIQSVGLLGMGISPTQGLYLNAAQHKQNKRTCTFMPLVRFESRSQYLRGLLPYNVRPLWPSHSLLTYSTMQKYFRPYFVVNYYKLLWQVKLRNLRWIG